jgi:hypothetical protein
MGYFSALIFTRLDKLNLVLFFVSVIMMRYVDRGGFVLYEPGAVSFLLPVSSILLFFALIGFLLHQCFQLTTTQVSAWMVVVTHRSKIFLVIVAALLLRLFLLSDVMLASIPAKDMQVSAERVKCRVSGKWVTSEVSEYNGNYCYNYLENDYGFYSSKIDATLNQEKIVLGERVMIHAKAYPSFFFDGSYGIISSVTKD